MQILDTITRLSHEFGTTDYVRGGGGNTSAKNDDTLWVKPPGTTLGGLRPETFVALDRAALADLYRAEPPADPAGREAFVKEHMLAAVRAGSQGRPSVEAPLHNVFQARYVVHTHPARVNGMTCAVDSAAACRRLFPEALWMDYVDPGFTLCMHMREAIERWRDEHGSDPSVAFLANHGVFIAGDTEEEIRALYGSVFQTLDTVYEEAGVSLYPPDEDAEVPGEMLYEIAECFRDAFGESSPEFIVGAPPATIATGPLSPDHIVYAKSFPFIGTPRPDLLQHFARDHGYPPRVVATEDAVFGVGDTANNARLALELALDGAYVLHLTNAFGGVRYLDERSREFIDNWEVEAYRRKIAAE